MSYKVTLWDANFPNTDTPRDYPKFHLSRAQAIQAMRKIAYAKLEAFGKLDTQAAHDVMDCISRIDKTIPPQSWESVTISNTGYSLSILNTARMPR